MSCTQDVNLQLSKGRRIFIFILGITDSMLFGGAIFGWPQLVYSLKTKNVYSNLCNSIHNVTLEEPKADVYSIVERQDRCHQGDDWQMIGEQMDHSHQECPAQDERFALIFTVAVLFFGVPGIAVGYMLYYAGLRTTRLLGCFMVATSFLCLSATTVENPYWLFPSVALLGFGGNILRMCGMQLGDLFPKDRSTAITIITGSYAASSSLYLIFSMMAEAEIPMAYVSYFFAAFSGVSALFSFLMPIHHIPCETDAEPSTESNKTSETSNISPPLIKSLLSLSSSLHVYWFFIGMFAINVYQQSFNVWVTASTCSMEETRKYTIWFSYSNLISVFMAPLGGYFTDFLVKKARKSSANRIDFLVKEIRANLMPLLVTTILTIVMYSCVLFHHPVAIVVSLMCMIVARPCVIAISLAYLRIRFPSDHFNRLTGTYCTAMSVLQFLQIPHFNLTQEMYYLTHSVTLLLLAVSLINPLHLMWTSYLQKAVKERDNLEGTINNNITKPVLDMESLAQKY